MEQIKELTKRLIANSFKELMLKMPFEKITIKTITDHANIIRPTFYNHFHDKYELMEWIAKTEVVEGVAALINERKGTAAIKFMFSKVLEDKEYYRRALDITGQNGFADTLSNIITDMFADCMDDDIGGGNEFLTKETIARYYASGLVTIIKTEVCRTEAASIDEIGEAYRFLMKNTVYDLFGTET